MHQRPNPKFEPWRGCALAAVLIGLVGACGEPSVARQVDTPVASGPASSHEGERTGTITGTVGTQGGEWSTLKVSNGSETHATASFSSPTEMMTDFSLQGHRTQAVQILGTVTIEFAFMNDRLVESGVKYFPEETTFPFYGDHDGSVEITIDQIDIDGDIATVTGQAFGKIYRVVNFRTDPDLADARNVDLRFEVTAHRR